MTKYCFQTCLFRLSPGLHSYLCTGLRCEMFFFTKGDCQRGLKTLRQMISWGSSLRLPETGTHSQPAHVVVHIIKELRVWLRKREWKGMWSSPLSGWASSLLRKGLSREDTLVAKTTERNIQCSSSSRLFTRILWWFLWHLSLFTSSHFNPRPPTPSLPPSPKECAGGRNDQVIVGMVSGTWRKHCGIFPLVLSERLTSKTNS